MGESGRARTCCSMENIRQVLCLINGEVCTIVLMTIVSTCFPPKRPPCERDIGTSAPVLLPVKDTCICWGTWHRAPNYCGDSPPDTTKNQGTRSPRDTRMKKEDIEKTHNSGVVMYLYIPTCKRKIGAFYPPFVVVPDGEC